MLKNKVGKIMLVLLAALLPLLTFGGITVKPADCVIIPDQYCLESAKKLAGHLASC